NRALDQEMELDIRAPGFGNLHVIEALALHDTDLTAENTKAAPDRIRPIANDRVTVAPGQVRAVLPAASWNLIRVATD
ncbi:MAG TPA: alpha-L-arabinofuranosidase C-terminal domain-containing protein, partial [Acetobacteraceae bacterium]|nr:alpha-L-arabinofuranosidase C-terminal domain-containing protein [Acetobacteraceae bacterium]